jgi:RNA polymerase sigma-70 factor (ECF subfamily)
VSERDDHYRTLFLQGLMGDQAAYRLLLEGISRLLKAYLMKTMNPRLRSQEQVEDLVQEVLISIHRKRDLYSEDRPFLPWVYAIARYRLIDSLRMDRRRPECVEWVEKFDAEVFVEMPKFLEEEDGAAMISCLNLKQQKILRLAKVDELPLDEVAEQMGMTLSAVKVSIHRSLKTIRKKLGYG